MTLENILLKSYDDKTYFANSDYVINWGVVSVYLWLKP